MEKKNTILLTGATGFLGSYLLRELISREYNVVILKRSYSNSWRIEDLLPKVTSYDIDKTNFNVPFQQQKIDTVIHTATNYGRLNNSLFEVADTNLLFSIKLLDTALKFETKVFINTDTLLNRDVNSYSLSKKQFLEWLKFFSNKIKVINLKFEHMYGPKDDDTKFVTWIIKQLIRNTPEINLTKGEQKRDFIYIDDVVNVFILMLDKLDSFKSFTEFDVGTGANEELRHFIKKIYHIVCKKKNINSKLNFGANPYRKGEPMEICKNIKPLYVLGWKPKQKIEMGINMIIEGMENE